MSDYELLFPAIAPSIYYVATTAQWKAGEIMNKLGVTLAEDTIEDAGTFIAVLDELDLIVVRGEALKIYNIGEFGKGLSSHAEVIGKTAMISYEPPSKELLINLARYLNDVPGHGVHVATKFEYDVEDLIEKTIVEISGRKVTVTNVAGSVMLDIDHGDNKFVCITQGDLPEINGRFGEFMKSLIGCDEDFTPIIQQYEDVILSI